MEFPVQLRAAIEEKIVGCKREPLLKTARSISDRYRTESGAGKKLVTTDAEATVYALTRMPATFGAVSAALRYALESAGLEIESLLDAGAGTGAAAWAADGLLPLKKVVCFERERAIRRSKRGRSLCSSVRGRKIRRSSSESGTENGLRGRERRSAAIRSISISGRADSARQVSIA